MSRIQANSSSVYFRLRHSTTDYCYAGLNFLYFSFHPIHIIAQTSRYINWWGLKSEHWKTLIFIVFFPPTKFVILRLFSHFVFRGELADSLALLELIYSSDSFQFQRKLIGKLLSIFVRYVRNIKNDLYVHERSELSWISFYLHEMFSIQLRFDTHSSVCFWYVE